MYLLLMQSILYLSWIVFPIIIYFIIKKEIILIILSLLFIYARFVEPKMLLTNEYKINVGFKARYALISDIHLGVYNDERILEKTVKKINNLKNIDAVLIAGDLLYEAKVENIEKLFSSLKEIKIPIYAVLGNHDYVHHQRKEVKELEKVFKELNIKILKNEVIKLNGINIVGLGSHWFKDDKVEILDQLKKEDKVVILTHNPDTTYSIKRDNFILLSGHTHGGQIRIPYLYKKIIPVSGKIRWNQGLYQYKNGQVFVSSGIGEIGLPMRFLIPPTIDVLEFY